MVALLTASVRSKIQARVLAHQVATHKEAFHGDKELLFNTDARIAVMQEFFHESNDGVSRDRCVLARNSIFSLHDAGQFHRSETGCQARSGS